MTDIKWGKKGLYHLDVDRIIPGSIKSTSKVEDVVIQNSEKEKRGRIQKAVELHEMLESSDIPIPELVEDGSEETVPYFVTEYIEDNRPEACFSDWDREVAENVTFQAGKYLGILHDQFKREDLNYGFLWADEDGLKREEDESWSQYVESQANQWLETASDLEFVDSETREIAEEGIEILVDEVPDNPDKTLMHGDYTLENMIIDDGDIEAIIDWDNAYIGDSDFEYMSAEAQFANHFHFEERESIIDTFREGYRSGGSTVPDQQSREIYEFFNALEQTAGITYSDRVDEDAQKMMASYTERLASKITV